MWRTDSSEMTLMLGKIEGGRKRGRQRMRSLDGITDSVDMSLSRLQELVIHREAWPAAVHGVTKSRTSLSDWTELNWTESLYWLLYKQNVAVFSMDTTIPISWIRILRFKDTVSKLPTKFADSKCQCWNLKPSNWGFPDQAVVKIYLPVQEILETLVWYLGQENPMGRGAW